MLLLLMLGSLLAPAAPAPAGKALEAYPADLAVRFGSATPDLVMAGDSRVYQLRFADVAAALSPDRSLTGGIWSQGGASVADMLPHLRGQGIRPRTLVLGASPLSMAMRSFTRAFRAGEDPEITPTQRLKDRLREGVLGALAFLPYDRGPVAISKLVERRLDPAWLKAREDAWEAQPPQNTVGYRFHFEEEAAPSEAVIRATVSAIRAFQAEGTRVVLLRLPVSVELRDLENRWGAPAALARIAAETGAPLVDLTEGPLADRLQPAILDGSHVFGEEATSALSREAGRRIREVGGDA